MAPCIFNLNSSWTWLVSFMLGDQFTLATRQPADYKRGGWNPDRSERASEEEKPLLFFVESGFPAGKLSF